MRIVSCLALVASAALLTPSPAHACGGFFCVSTPVEQNAERILFELDPAGPEVVATVEIKYNGDADDFAWVVPVSSLPENPELDVAPGSLMTLLEGATAPTLIFPPTRCSRPAQPFDAPMARGGGSLGDDDFEQGVDVTDLEQVGPYAPQRIAATDADALIEWLNTNGYLITAAMEPTVQEYVAQGYDFLGMKLAPEAGVSDIQPIVIRYPGSEPMVPVVLTSVAAEPEMAIMVFVAGDTRWEASNFTNLEIARDDRLQADPRTGADNYYPLVRWLTDEADGHAFVTEFAGPTDDVQVGNIFLNTEDAEEAMAAANAVLQNNSVLTRMTARMSGHEMTLDPAFAPSPGTAVGRIIDLSDRDAVEICGPGADSSPSTTPCGDTYCGVGAQCATTESGLNGCVCPEGHTARTISVPGGLNQPSLVETVTCLSSEDFLADVMGTPDGPADPCFANVCGENGTCAAVNGFATCACNDGFAAVPNGVGGQTCSAVLQTYEPTQLLWANAGCSDSSCAMARSPHPGWALLLLPALARRRRG